MSEILTLKHKGLIGEASKHRRIYYGKVTNLDNGDLVTFQSVIKGNLQKEFEFSVDDYIDFVKEVRFTNSDSPSEDTTA